MGPDLVNRGGEWVAVPRENYRKTIRAKSNDVASVYIRRIYRALFTRPLRSVRVYSVDNETRNFLRANISFPTIMIPPGDSLPMAIPPNPQT